MSRFFKPYEGKQPYIFVSYSHRTSDDVIDTARILHDKEYRVWYDEGIPAGSDWPANIARHVEGCEAVLFFLAKPALASPNCLGEISTACRLGKPVLVVRLDDSEPYGPWTDLLADKECIPVLNTPEERAEAALKTGLIGKRFRHSLAEHIPWKALGLVASLLLFLGAAAAFGALATGRWNPIPPPPEPEPEPVQTVEIPEVADVAGAERYFAVSFPDSMQEDAIRSALGKKDGEILRWNLGSISALYFCGNMVPDSTDGIAFYTDGVCRVNGAPVINGLVSDLSLFPYMARLEHLALMCQPVSRLSELNGLQLLKSLDLSGSSIDRVSELNDLPSLKTLGLGHTGVTDLTPLEELPSLREVTVSRDMLPLKWNDSAGFAVILKQDKEPEK